MLQTTQPDTQEDELDSQNSTNNITWGYLDSLNDEIKSVDIKHDVIIIGRHPACHIVLTNQLISAKHCEIQCGDNAIETFNNFDENFNFGKNSLIAQIKDLSSNGTFLNGKKIGKGNVEVLSNGDEIIFLKNRTNRKKIGYRFSFKKIFLEASKSEILNKYFVGDIIGRGAFSIVKMCILKGTQREFALKIVDKKAYSFAGIERKNAFEEEVKILKKVNHNNIIKIYDVFTTPQFLYIVLELVKGGDLFDKVISLGRIPEVYAHKIFLQLLSAVIYLHKKNICHRDLKMENILLVDADNYEIKVADFGLSRLIDNSSFIKTICGTPQYIAPEILNYNKGYNLKVDFQSMGVILYMMLFGKHPFYSKERNDFEVLEKVKAGEFSFPENKSKDISFEAIDLINGLLCVDPLKRLDGNMIMKHSQIEKFKTKSHLVEENMNNICYKKQKID